MQAQTVNEDNERGVITNVASLSGIEGVMAEIAYATSKGAVIGMTLPMARDLSRFGIRVNTIAPGPMATPMGDFHTEATRDPLLANIPLGRFGKPSEFAHVAKFLAENTYMTGSVIRLDGGLRVPFA
jgi:NAD(P)-dependent dehydrogenase (short-subunit alcohol dehydrogenase family)